MPNVSVAGVRDSEQDNDTDRAVGIEQAVVQDMRGRLFNVYAAYDPRGRSGSMPVGAPLPWSTVLVNSPGSASVPSMYSHSMQARRARRTHLCSSRRIRTASRAPLSC